MKKPITTLYHVYLHCMMKYNYTASYTAFKAYFFYFLNQEQIDTSTTNGMIFKNAIETYLDLKSKPNVVEILDHVTAIAA